MDKLFEILMQLGLSQYESKCYVALLGNFPAKPYQIGKTAGIPSAKIYEVIARLEQKGLIAEVSGEEKRYIPKDPDMVVIEWREQYLHLLKEAQQALKSHMTEKPVNAVWNVKGRREIVRLGKDLIARAVKCIFLAASVKLMDVWLPDLAQAQKRGVSVHLIAYGVLESRNEDVPVKELTTYTLRQNKRPGTVLAVDTQYALFVSSQNEKLQGAWTENPAIAVIAEEYVDDKLFIEQGIADRWVLWGSTD
jgi:sugar-specific transcriptional regulator TrmB